MEGFYDLDCPGVFRRCITLRPDGTIAGGLHERTWRLRDLADGRGERSVTRLEILDEDAIILYQFSPADRGWSTTWAGRRIDMKPLPKPVEVGGYDGPRGQVA